MVRYLKSLYNNIFVVNLYRLPINYILIVLKCSSFIKIKNNIYIPTSLIKLFVLEANYNYMYINSK